MGIITKKGDAGSTKLFNGSTAAKSDPRIMAIGDVDELNAAIGILSAYSLSDEVIRDLLAIQRGCFTVNAAIATPHESEQEKKDYLPRISSSIIEQIEERVARFEEALPPQRRFIIYGGAPDAACAYWVRTIARRAERSVVRFHSHEALPEEILKFMNRLSDYFFILARTLNHDAGVADVEWEGGHSS